MSLTDLYKYNYILRWIALYKNLWCFFKSFISIPYMTYNAQIRYYQYVCTMPIRSPHRIIFFL